MPVTRRHRRGAFRTGALAVTGALVLAVTGPAQKAGIRVGDVIVSLDGRAVSSSDDLGKIVFAKKPGDAVQVGLVSQQGRRRTVTLTLGVRPLPT